MNSAQDRVSEDVARIADEIVGIALALRDVSELPAANLKTLAVLDSAGFRFVLIEANLVDDSPLHLERHPLRGDVSAWEPVDNERSQLLAFAHRRPQRWSIDIAWGKRQLLCVPVTKSVITVAIDGEEPIAEEAEQFICAVAKSLELLAVRARDLRVADEARAALTSAREELDLRVNERTAELSRALRRLRAEMQQRQHSEDRHREAERELETQRVLSMRSDRLRSLGEMAAGIAHELNQPLVGVRGKAEHIVLGIERGWEISEDTLLERVRSIVDQADRMDHIIEHVRRFAREAGKPDIMPVQVNKVVEAAVELLSAQLRSRGIYAKTELAESLPIVSANPFSLEEVLLNLVINARDAVEESRLSGGENGDEVTIRTRLCRETSSSRVLIEIADCGIGVEPDDLERVFEPFYTTKDPHVGTGLGLSVSKSIVEQLDGLMWMESKPGRGTTVTVSLPVASAAEAPDRHAEGSVGR